MANAPISCSFSSEFPYFARNTALFADFPRRFLPYFPHYVLRGPVIKEGRSSFLMIMVILAFFGLIDALICESDAGKFEIALWMDISPLFGRKFLAFSMFFSLFSSFPEPKLFSFVLGKRPEFSILPWEKSTVFSAFWPGKASNCWETPCGFLRNSPLCQCGGNPDFRTSYGRFPRFLVIFLEFSQYFGHFSW